MPLLKKRSIVQAILMLLMLMIAVVACKKKDDSHAPVLPPVTQAPQDTCDDYVAFGLYYEYRPASDTFDVHDYYRVCSTGVFENITDRDSFPHWPIRDPYSLYTKLNVQKYNRVKNFEQYIPPKLLNDTILNYGQGGFCEMYYCITLRKNGILKSYVIADNNEEAFLFPIQDTIFAYAGFLQ